MASHTPSILAKDPHSQIIIVGVAIFLLIGIIFAVVFRPSKVDEENPSEGLTSYLRFFYASFLKPHDGDGTVNGQQDALESFYKAQAGVYDATRKRLLRGREDMLALVAAQLAQKAVNGTNSPKRIWVDVSFLVFTVNDADHLQIGGGTGWNIEAMSEFVSVPEFFSSVYLVDFSPSLCEVARKRFSRLGWKNVKVICQDARAFRLEDHEEEAVKSAGLVRSGSVSYFSGDRPSVGGADLITLSYSLSMIVSPSHYNSNRTDF